MVAAGRVAEVRDPPGTPARLLTVAVIGARVDRDPSGLLQQTLHGIASAGRQRDRVVVHDADELRSVIASAGSRYLMIVRAGEIVSAVAFDMLLGKLDSDASVGASYALWVPLDSDGRVSRLKHRAHREYLENRVSRDRHDAGLGALPTFRLDVLRECGPLSGKTIDDLLATAVRLMLFRSRLERIPRALAGRLAEVSPPRQSRANGSAAASRNATVTWLRGILMRAAPEVSPYDLIILAARLIPIGSLSPGRGSKRLPAAARVGCVTLRDTGLTDNRDTQRRQLAQFLRRRPLRTAALFLFVVRRRERGRRSLARDVDILLEAAVLAGSLSDRGVTHVHATSAARLGLPAFVAARLIGATFSVEGRESGDSEHLERNGLLDRLSGSDSIIANSEHIESSIRAEARGRRLPPLHIVHDGAFIDEAARRDSYAVRGDRFRIVAAGRLIERKGFRYLLSACSMLRSRGYDLECHIFGGADPADSVTWVELRRMLGEHALHDTVCFVGAGSNAGFHDSLRSADLFVLPAIEASDGSHDVMPRCILQAMASGLPVVSTRIGAIPELVSDGVDGILVEPANAAALADAIARLVDDQALRSRMGRAARSKIEQGFDLRVNAFRLAALLPGG